MDIVDVWTGAGEPAPQEDRHYTIGSCGTLPVCWTFRLGGQGEGYTPIPGVVLYFDGCTDAQRETAIRFFARGFEDAL